MKGFIKYSLKPTRTYSFTYSVMSSSNVTGCSLSYLISNKFRHKKHHFDNIKFFIPDSSSILILRVTEQKFSNLICNHSYSVLEQTWILLTHSEEVRPWYHETNSNLTVSSLQIPQEAIRNFLI